MPDQSLEITNKITNIEIMPDEVELTIDITKQEIVISTQGLQGPQGPTGNPGIIASHTPPSDTTQLWLYTP
jgi:hypothetical protein